MTPHMIEIRVRDWLLSRAWYERFLSRLPSLVDGEHEFALFETPPIRLAIKGGGCVPGSTVVMLCVDDLDVVRDRLRDCGIEPSSPEKTSPEGYRRLVYADPDGQRLILFQWLSREPAQ